MMTKSMMRPLALISLATAVVMASGVNHDFYTPDDNTTDTNVTIPLQTLEMRVDDDNKIIDSAIPLETLEMRLRANDGQKNTKRKKDNGGGSGNTKKKAGNVTKKKKTGSGGGRKKTRAGDVTTKKKKDKLPTAEFPNLRNKDKRTSAADEGKKAKVDATAIMKDTDERTSDGVRDEVVKEDKKRDVTTKKKKDKLPTADVPNLRNKEKRTSAADEGKKAKVDATAIMKDTDKRTSDGERDEVRKEDKKPKSSAAAVPNDSERAGKKGTNKATDGSDGSKITGKLDRFGQTLEREKEKKASLAEPITAKVDASSVMSNKGGEGGGKNTKKEQRHWESPSKPTGWSHSENTL
jgi:hypothetical protein